MGREGEGALSRSYSMQWSRVSRTFIAQLHHYSQVPSLLRWFTARQRDLSVCWLERVWKVRSEVDWLSMLRHLINSVSHSSSIGKHEWLDCLHHYLCRVLECSSILLLPSSHCKLTLYIQLLFLLQLIGWRGCSIALISKVINPSRHLSFCLHGSLSLSITPPSIRGLFETFILFYVFNYFSSQCCRSHC